MREKISTALQTKFVGVDSAIIGRIADKLAKTVTTEEQIATSVEGVTFQTVIDNYTESRVTEAQRTAVANYEKKHGLKDGLKIEGEPQTQTQLQPQSEGGDIMSQIGAMIEEKLKPISERFSTMDKQTQQSVYRTKLASILTDKKIPEIYFKERVREKDFADEQSLNDYADQLKVEYDDFMQEMTNNGFSQTKTPDASDGNVKSGVDALAELVNQETTRIAAEKSTSK